MLRRPMTALLFAAVALAVPSSASAGILVADAPNCDAQSASQVFLPWADVASYVLAPGGAAESTAGWSSLSSGASIVSGSEPFAVHSSSDASALRLQPGASATTGTMCVGIEHPTVRFFTTGGLGSSVSVSVLTETASGDVISVPAGVAGAGAWSPTAVMPVLSSLLPLLPGDHTPVRFQFTSTGSEPITIDDVYVDPFGRY